MQAAARAPASRGSTEAETAAIDTLKPSPPSASTTTLSVPAPERSISPADEQPATGRSPATVETAAASAERS